MLRRLPGIRVINQIPEQLSLPRMDVACFVGFAERGPLHRPVLIQSMGAYGEVFGGDLMLARTTDGIQAAYLPSAVRAFFANGGQRCYVVRVADSRSALKVQNLFPLTGIAQATWNGTRYDFRPVYMRAASMGSWSDALRTRTSLTVEPITTSSIDIASKTITVAHHEQISEHDLLRITYDNVRYFFPVSSVTMVADNWQIGWRTEELLCMARPDSSDSFNVLRWMTNWQQAASGTIATDGYIIEDTGQLSVTIARPTEIPSSGTLFWSTNGDCLVLNSETIEIDPDNDTQIIITGQALIWTDSNPIPIGTPRVERLTFNVDGLLGQQSPVRVRDMAFVPEHPRYWGKVPDAISRYDDRQAPKTDPDLINDAKQVNFPLAGLLPQRLPYLPHDALDDFGISVPQWQNVQTAGISIPIGLAFAPTIEQAPTRPIASSIERNGLADFRADLFLDEALRGNTIHTLQTHADDIRYRNTQPRRLQGIHAALSIPDVSIIAVPDLVHHGWEVATAHMPVAPEPSETVDHPEWRVHPCDDEAPTEPQWQNFLDHDIRIIAAPTLTASAVNNGRFTLTWVSPEIDAMFYLEEATRPDWSDAEIIYEGQANTITLYGRGVGDYYYRVRLQVGKNRSEWSAGVVVSVMRDLGWVVTPPSSATDAMIRTVQHELLRMCMVSGTIFAILTMPNPLRAREAQRYAQALQPSSDAALNPPLTSSLPLSYMEELALSYGALFHPWLYVDDGDDLRLTPPDGVISGLLAKRALQRGAWIAPANDALDGIVALRPNDLTSQWADLREGAVNLVQRRATGTMTMTADTLSRDPQWRDISVRRLIMLIRRMLLPIAEEFVFEPNNRVLERTVVRQINAILNELFLRRAFAGNTPDKSYQVRVVSRNVDRDAGRFIVEIKVAPALPMQFITIHLIQSNSPRIEEV